MKKIIFVITDDLTGASDVGSLAARHGIESEIIVFPEILKNRSFSKNLVIVNTETRNNSAREAYRKTRLAASSIKKFNPYFVYKKCDSTLRGSIGSEIDALIEVFGLEYIDFVPAWPAMKRTTSEYIHYVDGRPITETFFANDPKSPVRFSSLIELLKAQSKYPEKIIPRNAATEKGLKKAAANVNIRFASGSSGFFEQILSNISYKRLKKTSAAKLQKKKLPCEGNMLIINGSKNPLSTVQVDYFLGEMPKCPEHKFSKYVKTYGGCGKNNVIIINAGWLKTGKPEKVMRGILSLAQAVNELYNLKYLIIFGGETSYRICRNLGINALFVKGWIESGIAVCEPVRGSKMQIILKPGGYGSRNFLAKAACGFLKN